MHDVLDPQGPAAEALARFGWPVLVFFTLTTIVMWALLLWVAFRRRGSFARHASVSTGGGISWILVGGIGIPAAVFFGFFIGMLGELNAFPIDDHNHGGPDIRVTGHRWWWEIEYRIGGTVDYVTTATELHVPIGRAMDIELITRDVIHSFWVPSLHGKVDLVPRMPTRIVIQADAPGRYRGECAEYCGTQHSNMIFWVVAEPPAEFDAWLAWQRQEAVAPATPEAQHGQEIFLSRACVLCHTVRGTRAHGSIGPDLTHFGGRRALAGPFPNNPAYLRAWVSHAQSLKPGVVMPSIFDFTGPELQDLTGYLQSLQ
jgi:cytochrome c oxidase subunit 2